MNFDILNNMVCLLIGGGLFKFVEFWIKRKDEKKEKKVVLVTDCKERGKRYEEWFAADKEKLDKLDSSMDKVMGAVTILLQNDMIVMEHMKTNNASNQMANRQEITDAYVCDLIKK